MRFFASDFKKYFYLAELYSLVDLSSVGPACCMCSCATSSCCDSNHILSSVCRMMMNHIANRGLTAAPSLLQMVKMGVQYSLWGGSVVNLGTERHREKYFDDIDSFRLPGCGSLDKPSGHSGPVSCFVLSCHYGCNPTVLHPLLQVLCDD